MTGVSGSAARSGGAVPGRPARSSAVVIDGVDLDSVSLDVLDDHQLLEHIATTERAAARVASLQLAAMTEFARRPSRVETAHDDRAAVEARYARPGRWVREFADDEVAARLRISSRAAANRIRLGCALVRLPATAAALHDGRIDIGRARVLADETAALDPIVAREVEATVIAVAERLPAARLRPHVRRAAIAADPIAAQSREVRARTERRVVITPVCDGMAEVWAYLPAVEAMAIDTALRAAARAARAAAAPGDDRTTDQLRADSFAAPFLAALATGELGGRPLAEHRGRPAELQVTVAATTLLGLDDQPADLRGYGPITAQAARAIAPDSRWRRILTDPPSGTVLDVGTRVYRPPADLQRHVEVRDQRCTYPGCGAAATSCDLDHTVEFPLGPTSAGNLAPRCRRHHRLKQSGAVSVEQLPDGTTRWVLPTGHQYDVPRPAIAPPEQQEQREPPEQPAPPDDP